MRHSIIRGVSVSLLSLSLTGQVCGKEPQLLPLAEDVGTTHVAIDALPPLEGAPAIDDAAPEIIRERYPSREVRIERHVVQDVQQNYLNHGAWSWWDERGQLLGRGEYRQGKRHGKWTRIHAGEKAEKGTLFALPLYRGFERPLTSEATFENGHLHGAWTVVDAKGRKVSQWLFDQDQQHGLSTWWHANGQTQRTANYSHGLIDGELSEFNLKGEQTVKEQYLQGYRIDQEVAAQTRQANRSERSLLVPVARQHYNWFDATVTLDRVQQTKVYHGLSTWWHPNGQKEMAGQYERGIPDGEFTWWHSNGQERSRGQYRHGTQEGKWTWWHVNGQKEVEGQYHQGQRVGQWAGWTADGKVRLVEEHALENHPSVPTETDKHAAD